MLIGSPGVGKTWLARTAADRLASQINRVDWVTPTAPAVPFSAFNDLIEVPATGKTAAVLRDGWLSTGDGGYLDSEGYLFLTDRIKDMIVTGAENVYPIEVEDVLAAHPGVGEVAVIGIPDEKWGEIVTAVVVPRGEGCDADTLVAFARERLAS